MLIPSLSYLAEFQLCGPETSVRLVINNQRCSVVNQKFYNLAPRKFLSRSWYSMQNTPSSAAGSWSHSACSVRATPASRDAS